MSANCLIIHGNDDTKSYHVKIEAITPSIDYFKKIIEQLPNNMVITKTVEQDHGTHWTFDVKYNSPLGKRINSLFENATLPNFANHGMNTETNRSQWCIRNTSSSEVEEYFFKKQTSKKTISSSRKDHPFFQNKSSEDKLQESKATPKLKGELGETLNKLDSLISGFKK